MLNNSESAYPVREHIHMPTDPAEWIDEELRTGGHGSQLRESLVVGLEAIYGKSPLVKSFKMYANALATARKFDSHGREQQLEERKPLRTQAFNAGSLLATHTMTQVLEPNMRQRVLRRKYGDDSAVQDLFEETNRGMKVAAKVLNDADSFTVLFESQSMELQDAVMTAAGQTFDDLPATPRTEYEHEFMFGYIFSANAISVIYEELSKNEEEDIDFGYVALP